MAVLIIEKGAERGKSVEISPGSEVVFGRDPAADLVTTDTLCSRRHFAVSGRDGTFSVRDLDSRNGTWLNDRRITEHVLHDGDVIRAGETMISFVREAAGGGRGLVGKMVGGYRILDRIGRGGMGTVFRANQISLNRIVALKVLSARYASDRTFVNRFLKEAQAAGRLNHPNIVQVYDVGEDRELYFYSMELIEQGSLQDLATKEGRIDAERALRFLLDAAAGLVYAEKKQLVHRDIKPDNLMINAEGLVKIADLGLAHDLTELRRIEGAPAQGDGEAGEPDGIFGTPHFISPEQARGLPVDTRSDIYSLGASFYRILTGRTPFSGTDVREIVQHQIQDDPEPLRTVEPSVPAALAGIVERMMRKDPAERFPSAAALLDALEGFRRNLDGTVPRRRRGLVVAALVLVAGGAVATWLARRPRDEPSPYPRWAESRATTRNTEAETRSAADAARIRAESRRLEAGRLLLEAETALARRITGAGPDLPLAERAARLGEVAARFEAVSRAFTDTEEGRRARERAAALRREETTALASVAESRAAAESRRAAAQAAAESLAAEVTTLLEARRFARAEALLRRRAADFAGTDEEDRIRALAGTIATAARTVHDEAVARAESLAAESRYDEARSAVEGARAAFELDGDAPESHPALADAARDLAARGEAFLSAGIAKRDRELAEDRTAAWRALRAAGDALHAGLVPEAAAAALRQVREGLRSDAYRQRIDATLANLSAMATLIDRLGERLAGDGVGNRTVRFQTVKVAGGALRLRGADRSALRVAAGSGDISVPWEKIPAEEAWQAVFRDRWEMSQDEVLLAAAFCLEADLPEEVLRILPQGDEAGDAALALRAEARREAEALKLVADCYEQFAGALRDDRLFLRVYPLADRLVREFATTRAFLRHSDGSTHIARLGP